MSALHSEVAACDLPVLRDLLRYRVMAEDQIARRYGEADLARERLIHLCKVGMVAHWRETLDGAHIFEPTSRTRLAARVPGVQRRKVYELHLAHDIAVVDLADYLERSGPNFRFIAETEIRAFLDQIGPPPRYQRGDSRHRPDGVLVDGTQRIAIELEHSDKYGDRYREISKWFVREMRIDAVRWYIDRPGILQRIQRVNTLHGFDRDLPIELLEFPPGVRVRKRLGRYAPWRG